MTQWIKTKGKLIFDLDHKTNKHIKQGSWKKSAMIIINDDLSAYYSWFINKRFNLDLSIPLRGSHLTIINDKVIDEKTYQYAKNMYDGSILELEYNPNVRTNGDYWWLIARCRMGKKVRKDTGLNPDPYFSFHITIGRPHDRQKDYSHYIHRQIIKFKGTTNI